MSDSRATSRRDFLKSTAAAGAALAVAQGAYAAGSDTIKVGLVGCGGRGSGAAENVLHSSKGVEIVAIGDVFKFRADGCRKRLLELNDDGKVKELGNKIDLPQDRVHVGLDAFEKVINTPDVNYVILATPPGFRPIHLAAAVAAGKNVFTEKPVGVDGPGIRKVLAVYDEAMKKGLGIGAGTQRRHQAPYIETIKQIKDGAIGDVVAMRCYWNQGNIWFRNRDELARLGIEPSDLAYQLHNWYHFVWTCGDHIVEQHVHNLDVCNWIMGTHPVRASGMGARINRPNTGNPNVDGNIFDQFAIDFEYENGTRMLSMCRQIAGCDNSVSEAAHGSKGFCQVNAYTINGKRIASRRAGNVNPYVQEHTDLIESIRSGKPINELKTVAESTLTAIMGRMAGYTGKPVTWAQALASKQETMPPNLSWDMTIQVPPAATPGKTPLT